MPLLRGWVAISTIGDANDMSSGTAIIEPLQQCEDVKEKCPAVYYRFLKNIWVPAAYIGHDDVRFRNLVVNPVQNTLGEICLSTRSA